MAYSSFLVKLNRAQVKAHNVALGHAYTNVLRSAALVKRGALPHAYHASAWRYYKHLRAQTP